MLNYKKIFQPTHYIDDKEYDGDLSVPQEFRGNSEVEISRVPLRQDFSNSSVVLEYVDIGQNFMMQREWADGKGQWAFVKVTKTGTEGYILTKYLTPGSNGKDLLPKSPIVVENMSPMAKVLIPEWHENTTPYYHRENGEWWVTVTLPYTCIDSSQGLSDFEPEATDSAVRRMYDYFSAPYEGVPVYQGNVPSVEEFINAPLSTLVKDYYLSTRPGSKLKILVIIPAVYLQYVNKQAEALASSIPAADLRTPYKFSIPVDSLDNLSRETTNCLKRRYQDYLNSDYRVQNFNFESEIKKIQDCIQKIKFLLIQNDIDIRAENPKHNNRAVPQKIINVYFTENSFLRSVSVSSGTKEQFMTIGFSEVVNSYPFNEPRACNMFLNQNNFCNSSISLKGFFESYVLYPDAVVTTVSKRKNFKKVGEFGTVGLGVTVDTENILNNIAQSFNGTLGLDGNIDHGSFRYSGKDMDFKLQAIEYRDMQMINSGDFLTSASFVSDLKSKLGFGGLDELYDLALSHIDLGKLFSAMGSFYDSSPGNESADTSDAPDLELPSFSTRLPSFNLLDTVQKGLIIAFEAALAGIVLGMIIFALESLISMLQSGDGASNDQDGDGDMGTANALEALTATSAASLGAMSMGAGSSSNPIGTPLGSTPLGSIPNPSSAALIGKDYGASNINDLMKDSIGTFDEDIYAENLTSIFGNCGIPANSTPGNTVVEYLDAISSMVAPIEMLSLFEGSPTKNLLEDVRDFTNDKYPSVFSHVPVLTISVISDFFSCLGDNISPRSIEEVENTITNYYTNPVVCQDIARELENIMCEKCQNTSVYNSVFQKEITSKVDKYKKILDLLKDSSSSLSPNIFNKPYSSPTSENALLPDGSGGSGGGSGGGTGGGTGGIQSPATTDSAKQNGILSRNKPKSQNFLLERMAETMTAAPKGMSKFEASVYFTKLGPEFANFVLETIKKPKLITQGMNAGGREYWFNNTNPKYTFGENGFQTIESVKVGGINKQSTLEQIYQEPIAVPEVVEKIFGQSIDYQQAKAAGMSQAQSVLYELIQDYFIKNSRDAIGNPLPGCGSNAPVPYLVTKKRDSYENDNTDDLFYLIFSQTAERILREAGDAISGGDEEAITEELTGLSEKLQNEIENMVDYTQAKEDMAEHYDLGDFEDPNDDSIVGPKEYSILNGLIKVYVTIYIVEFFSRGYPFYKKFDLEDSDQISKISKNYIIKMIEADLSNTEWNSYNSIFNSTFDFIKTRSDLGIDADKYSGNSRGIDYYIDQNFNETQKKFQQTMSSGSKAVLSDFLLYSKTESLPPHSNAGNYGLVEDNELGGKSVGVIKDVTEKNFSLFKGSRYNKFKNGMFFIQKYLILEDLPGGTLDFQRNRSTQGVISPNMDTETWDALNNAVSSLSDPANSAKKLKALFKNIRIGSRLCYGIAVDPSDESVDPDIQEVASKIFNNYSRNKGMHSPSGNPKKSVFSSATIKQFRDPASYGKYLVCHDGDNCKVATLFGAIEQVVKKPLGSLDDYIDADTAALALAIGTPGQAVAATLVGDITTEYNEITSKVQSNRDFYMGDGTYSIVIPLFKREEQIPFESIFGKSFEDMAWKDFNTSIKSNSKTYDTVFQNLRNDIITSEEYKALTNLCFSLDNILLFNVLGGIQSYGTSDLFSAFVQTKKMLKENMKVTMNSRKYDYMGG